MRKLDTPKTVSEITEQVLPRFLIEIAFETTEGKGPKIALKKTGITYTVADTDANGAPRRESMRTVFHGKWPPEVKKAVQTMMAWAWEHADSAGMLEEGKDKPDLK